MGRMRLQATVNLRFAGQYFNGKSDLHYNWNRYYDSETGRYITSDPIGLDGGLNTFGYSNANPVMFTDPEGLKTVPIPGPIGMCLQALEFLKGKPLCNGSPACECEHFGTNCPSLNNEPAASSDNEAHQEACVAEWMRERKRLSSLPKKQRAGCLERAAEVYNSCRLNSTEGSPGPWGDSDAEESYNSDR